MVAQAMYFKVCYTEAKTSVPKWIYLLIYSGHLAFYPLTPTLYCCQNIFLWRAIFTFSFFRLGRLMLMHCVVSQKQNAIQNVKNSSSWMARIIFPKKKLKSKSIWFKHKLLEIIAAALFCKTVQEKFNFLWPQEFFSGSLPNFK